MGDERRRCRRERERDWGDSDRDRAIEETGPESRIHASRKKRKTYFEQGKEERQPQSKQR